MSLFRQPVVYILTNHTNTVLYIGVTTDITKRVWEHRQKVVKGFTEHYRLYKLVYYECFESIVNAIEREKQLKKWSRKKKEWLIYRMNSKWEDLYDQIGW